MDNKIQNFIRSRMKVTAYSLVEYYKSGVISEAVRMWYMLLGEAEIALEILDCEEMSGFDLALNSLKAPCEFNGVKFSDVCYRVVAE